MCMVERKDVFQCAGRFQIGCADVAQMGSTTLTLPMFLTATMDVEPVRRERWLTVNFQLTGHGVLQLTDTSS